MSQSYHSLSKYLSFPNLDQYQWWQQAGPTLSKMLSTANYPIDQQYQYLLLLGLHIIPLLGPYPSPQRPGLYKSPIGGIGTLELSQNFTKDQTTVRMGFEPVHYTATTGPDDCNQLIMNEAITTFKRLDAHVDLSLYHSLVSSLTLTSSELDLLRKKDSLKNQPVKSQHVLGVDLQNGDLLVKVYIYPQLKALARETSVSELILSALRKVDGGRLGESACLSVLREFIADESVSAATTPVTFLSCDLVEPSRARFKVYLAEFQFDVETLSRNWTLGGRLDDADTLVGLEMVRELWTAFRLPGGLREPPKPGDSPARLPFLFNFEMQSGRRTPRSKVYFPLADVSDLHVATVLTGFFERYGCAGLTRSYTENLMEYFPGVDLKESVALHAWLSFSYSKTGPYMTVYYQWPDSFNQGHLTATRL
ncbi:aromatic prenyltransferase [Aspergillus coremiiformis]|uniref:Aromatic prenyltransferase n=1 Tax=Aspergillus coremiiformis TaxID=138285 RepID=A0A5N6Z4U0_9EURO|nr:aromatic prenyltransferase [Aspergillus coremiiformis]